MQNHFPTVNTNDYESAAPRIGFSNHYMFERVMRDEAICRGVLEAILGFPIGRIGYVNSEQSIVPSLNSRGVRLDVYASDGSRIYDIEIQCSPEPSLGKRFRYYQSAIDLGLLGKGADFDLLPESYVIFLCTDDPFGAGLPRYSFERTCLENNGILVGDGSHWLVLNAAAWQHAHDEELRNLLRYIDEGDAAADGIARRIDDAVNEANDDSRWVSNVWSVSTIEENEARRNRILRRQAEAEGKAAGHAIGLAEGRAEGLVEGEGRYNALVAKLLSRGRLDDLEKATKDQSYRDALFAEFDL